MAWPDCWRSCGPGDRLDGLVCEQAASNAATRSGARTLPAVLRRITRRGSYSPGYSSLGRVQLTPPGTAHSAGYSSLPRVQRSEEHTSELQSQFHLVCRLQLEKKSNPCCPCWLSPLIWTPPFPTVETR